MLKSGCTADNRLFGSADRLQRGIAIHAVVSWRIMLMTLFGRQVPECDAELMFSEAELAFLREYARRADLSVPLDRTSRPNPGNFLVFSMR